VRNAAGRRGRVRVPKTHQLIIELENAQAEEATAFVNDLRTHSDLEVMELSSRDIPLLMDFLVPWRLSRRWFWGQK
jgi:hypothetical protein